MWSITKIFLLHVYTTDLTYGQHLKPKTYNIQEVAITTRNEYFLECCSQWSRNRDLIYAHRFLVT
jgi:hypothetical protein